MVYINYTKAVQFAQSIINGDINKYKCRDFASHVVCSVEKLDQIPGEQISEDILIKSIFFLTNRANEMINDISVALNLMRLWMEGEEGIRKGLSQVQRLVNSVDLNEFEVVRAPTFYDGEHRV